VQARDVPQAPPRSTAAMLGPEPEPEGDAEQFDAFAHEPPFRPRRNRARLWTALTIAAAIIMLAATAAILYFGVPGTGGSLAIGRVGGTPLKIEGKGERGRMASGNELLTVSGQITNPTDEVQRVPPIRAELRDAQGRAVYTWPISPPVSELQPGATATFNSAEVDVPRGATAINLSFGPAA
jgi:hypothetical protein